MVDELKWKNYIFFVKIKGIDFFSLIFIKKNESVYFNEDTPMLYLMQNFCIRFGKERIE